MEVDVDVYAHGGMDAGMDVYIDVGVDMDILKKQKKHGGWCVGVFCFVVFFCVCVCVCVLFVFSFLFVLLVNAWSTLVVLMGHCCVCACVCGCLW